METVAVLMSTYNGEKYLLRQIDSVLKQSGVKVELFVRDDGSSDTTKTILTEYAADHENVHVEFGENVGVGNSFMNMLYAAPDDFDYYAFCDQDDIWEEDKLSVAAEELKKAEAYLYTSNQECVDKDGVTMGLRYSDDAKINLTPESIMQNNMVAGCTMVFVNEFFKILTAEKNRPSEDLLYNRIHDVWVAFTAALYGKIIYDRRSFIRYRQHENNVVGIKPHKGEKLKKIKNKKLRNGRSAIAREAYERFPELVREYPLVELSAKADTFAGKRGLIGKRKEICNITGESKLGFIAKVMGGLY